MKKHILTLICTAIAALSIAQTDPAATKMLNEVSKKYDAYKTIRSEFDLTVQDANKTAYSNTGIMYFNKPKKQYAIKMEDQEILSNGKTVWNISHDIKEVQITDAEHDDSTIGPNNLFSFYKKGYKYVSMPEEKLTKNGKTESLRVVELSPLDTKTNYFKIKLRINQNNHIHDVTIFDKSSNRFTYTIKSLYLGQKFDESTFTFAKDKFKNYEIIDLR
ncbi:LolA family protein [Sphingobacterium yanglingense]|uniref:Outer membrane lipoprotein-sorting protein n=1 Tax=Sphingobacterium yanglingense TaxID=1437280 RepID=A0A4R6WKX9_9SPHI|nr:outer membrane lipoprotein carrier protein LolA [Sphingobacterium yanglingense]TDQ76471.1 outer membrane lipoprotein-sorting protein [Sphingobacterium yanglingense]